MRCFRMKTKLLIFLLFIAEIGVGQTNEIPVPKLSIETAPLSLIDVYGGYSYRIGSEFKLHNNMSMYLEGGGYLNFGTGTTGYILSVECKYYFKSGNTERYYVSLEGEYKSQAFNWTDTVRLANPKYVATFRIYKTVECINGGFGAILPISKRFFGDLYCGIGIRYKQATANISQQEYNEMEVGKDDDYGLFGFMTEIGNFTYLNLMLGVKVGYRIE